jgi:hypothetical protein
MEAHGKVEAKLHSLSTSALNGDDRSALHPGRSTTGKQPDTDWIKGWVSPRARLDILEKRKISFPWRDSNPGRSSPYLVAIRTKLYRLNNNNNNNNNNSTSIDTARL